MQKLGRGFPPAGRGGRDLQLSGSPNKAIQEKLIGKYPAGKGANWVEIVSFD